MNSNDKPLVCICVPTYNSAKTVAETIDSILAQSYKNIHVLIVDNASTDETVKIISRYASDNANVKLHEFKEHVDGTQSCRRCVDLAYGDYTAIYHSDDVYEKSIVEKEVEFLEKNRDAGAVFTSSLFIDEFGKECGQHKIPVELLAPNSAASFEFKDIFRNILKYGDFLFCPSAMVRAVIYKTDLSLWNVPKYSSANDVAVWLKILQAYKIGIINERLMRYRRSIHSFSYHYSRTKTKRHDIFCLLDDCIAKYGEGVLSSKDRMNYRIFQMRDNIARSINCIINNDGGSAREALNEQLSFTFIFSSLSSLSGAYVFFVGCLVCLLSCLPIGESGRHLLYCVRYKSKLKFSLG